MSRTQEQGRCRLEQHRSEQRFRGYLDLPLIGIAVISPEMSWLEVNDKLCDILGYRREELLPTAWANLVHLDDVETDIAGVLKAAAGEVDACFPDKRLIRKDGRVIYVNISARCVRHPDGSPDYFVVLVEDITDRQRSEQALRESEERFRAIADYTYAWESWIGPDGSLLWINPAVERITGYLPEECFKMPGYPLPLVYKEDRPRLTEAFREAVAGSSGDDLPFRVRRKDGRIIWAAVSWQPIFNSRGERLGHRSSVRDITGSKEAEQQLQRREERFRALAENLPGMVYLCRHDRRRPMLYVNQAIQEFTGVAAKSFLDGRASFVELCHEDDLPELLEGIDAAVARKRPFLLTYRVLHVNGSWRWVEERGQAVFDENGAVEYLLGTIFDVTERKLAEQERKAYAAKLKAANFELQVQKQQLKAQQEDLLRQNEEMEELTRKLGETNGELALLTRIDPLTRLLNRRAWCESAQQQHERLLRYGNAYSILMIDVDHFKGFNDSQGHQAGDECLVRLAWCILTACRSTDFAGRYGGEEFVVLAPETGLETAATLAERIRAAISDLNMPHPASPVADRVTVCVGVAASDGGPWEHAVKRADNALYGAKHAGRNRVSVDLPARLFGPEPIIAVEQDGPDGDGGNDGAGDNEDDTGDMASDGPAVTAIEEFAERLPHRVAAIEGALAVRDSRLLVTLAAQLKDAAGGCGAQAFADLATEVEEAAATDPDFNHLTAQVRALITLCRRGRVTPTVV